MSIGATIADNHKINHRLNMFDQITFPTESDQLPFNAAIPERNNSGADVHMANTVSPIKRAETLKYWAILTLVLIRWFAQYHNKKSHITSNIIAIIISGIRGK